MSIDSSRILTDDFPRRAYKQQSDATLDSAVVKSIHFGQRKLLLSEVEYLTFLTLLDKQHETQHLSKDTASKPYLVIYAGAAMGLHLTYLFELFVDVKFILIDPAPFCQAVRTIALQPDGPVLEIIDDYCTDEVCLRLSRMYGKKYRIVLISDIRSGDPSRTSNTIESNLIISRDNSLQRDWCYSLKAHSAMLKFHPPYPPSDLQVASTSSNIQETEAKPSTHAGHQHSNGNEKKIVCAAATGVVAMSDEQICHDTVADTRADEESVVYLDGIRLFGVWSPKSSSEVRLVLSVPFVTDSAAIPYRRYSMRAHEEQCYFYNTTDRFARDCRAERTIWQQYCLLASPLGREGAEALSRRASAKLGHPLFCPLQPTFTEQHARWLFLLYSTQKRDALQYYDMLKHEMTREKVTELVATHKDATVIPAHVTIGSMELSTDFWRTFCKGNFTEAYSFPPVRWRFWRHLWRQGEPRKGARKRRSARDEQKMSGSACPQKRSRTEDSNSTFDI